MVKGWFFEPLLLRGFRVPNFKASFIRRSSSRFLLEKRLEWPSPVEQRIKDMFFDFQISVGAEKEIASDQSILIGTQISITPYLHASISLGFSRVFNSVLLVSGIKHGEGQVQVLVRGSKTLLSPAKLRIGGLVENLLDSRLRVLNRINPLARLQILISNLFEGHADVLCRSASPRAVATSNLLVVFQVRLRNEHFIQTEGD